MCVAGSNDHDICTSQQPKGLTLVDAEHAAGLADDGSHQRHVDGSGANGEDVDSDAADGCNVCKPAEVPA